MDRTPAPVAVGTILWCISGLLLHVPALAITIRHDVPDANYLALAATTPYDNALAMYYFPISDPSQTGWCSGTLIHPEWVLTAAHCVIDSPSWSYTVVRGPDRADPTESIPVDVKIRNASFNSSNIAAGNDFGLLHLTTPVLDATPARIYRGTGELGGTATVLGYGLTGNGQTGQVLNLPQGLRRAMQNVVDVFGNSVGWSSKLMLTDFDNPDNPGDNVFGSATPLGLEGQVALYDSGGGWYQQIGGVQYLTGVTSFRASTDGVPDSDYGDISGAGRVGQDLTWIDTRYDRTLFWNGSTGNWNQAAGWYGGIVPTSVSAAVIDAGSTTVAAAGATAEYVFVQGTGRLTLAQSLDTTYLRVRNGGRLDVGSPTGTVMVNGRLQQEGGLLHLDINGTASGQYDQLLIGNVALLSGQIEIETMAGYTGPASRGGVNLFTLLTAASVQGNPAGVTLDGDAISTQRTYVGSNNAGQDGLFAKYQLTGTQFSLELYLALPGDANGDGVVDGSDFGIWNANKFTTGTRWNTADFNGDGNTDGSDFGIWNANKFTSALNTPSVPEPTAWFVYLFMLGTWGALRRGQMSHMVEASTDN